MSQEHVAACPKACLVCAFPHGAKCTLCWCRVAQGAPCVRTSAWPAHKHSLPMRKQALALGKTLLLHVLLHVLLHLQRGRLWCRRAGRRGCTSLRWTSSCRKTTSHASLCTARRRAPSCHGRTAANISCALCLAHSSSAACYVSSSDPLCKACIGNCILDQSGRRLQVFRDGYDAMHGLAATTLKGRLQLQFINEHEEVEAGVDGGGLFKDFLECLLQVRVHF